MQNEIKHVRSPKAYSQRVPKIIKRNRKGLAKLRYPIVAALFMSAIAATANADPRLAIIVEPYGNLGINQFSEFTPKFTGIGGEPPLMPYGMRVPSASITTKFGISEHVPLGAKSTAKQKELKDVTYTLTLTGSGLTDEDVQALVETAESARGLLGVGFSGGMKSASDNHDLADFVAAWSKTINRGDVIEGVNVGYSNPGYGTLSEAVTHGEGNMGYTWGNFSADQTSLNVSEHFVSFEAIDVNLADYEATARFFLKGFESAVGTEATPKWQWSNDDDVVRSDIASGKMGASAWQVDYADMTKRRIGGGGTAEEMMNKF